MGSATTEAVRTIETLVASRYAYLYLLSHEEARWEREVRKLGAASEIRIVSWTATSGVDTEWGREDLQQPGPLLDYIQSHTERAIFLLKDYHPNLSDPRIVRKMRDMEEDLAAAGKAVLFLSPVLAVPPEMEKDVAIVDLPLPDLEDLKAVLKGVLMARSRSIKKRIVLDDSESEMLLRGVLGLTEKAAARVLARALAACDAFHPEVLRSVLDEKRRVLRGSELLEFVDATETIDAIGGLEDLKGWLKRRSLAFTQKARRYKLPQPKGILLVGVQGCGKSLTARAVADLWKFPLVRLDMGAVMAAEEGRSEGNFRRVIKILESIAPVVLWIDELEKTFAGAWSTEERGGVARVLGTFVTWLQEKSSPVFVVATANRVEQLPPELLRKGRFDEFFFVDLPSFKERQAILSIHLAKRGWNPGQYDLVRLARVSEGFSGAEIEESIVSAMYESFGQDRPVKTDDILAVMERVVPLSITMEEKVDALRDWAKERARPASPDTRLKDIIDEGRVDAPIAQAIVLDQPAAQPFRIVRDRVESVPEPAPKPDEPEAEAETQKGDPE